jgi:CDP-4-dehydro-6-deoxyglucose reductase
MFTISLKNGKSFTCDSNTTIFDAAKNNGINLEHSCLSARCRSCAVRIEAGATKDKLDDLVLSDDEKKNKWVLSCNAIPTSNIILDVEELNGVQIFEKKIIPAKILSKEKINESVMEVCLRLPQNSNFQYSSGQYVKVAKGDIKRSYSIANTYEKNGILTFYIKKYESGKMSNYWFNEAKVNDLLRVEGPFGSFFLRENPNGNIIFLATGTGIAPIKSILDDLEKSMCKYSFNRIWLFVGARFENDLFWNPSGLSRIKNFKYIPVLSRASEGWLGEKGYVQDIVIKHNIPLAKSHVYACGSINMINSAQKLLIKMGLDKAHFFSDPFLQSN